MSVKKDVLSPLRRDLLLKLEKFGQEQPFIAGSLVKIHRRCGNPNCRCAQADGEKHPAYLLTSKVNGKTKSVYVPVDMVDEVSQWCRRYRELKEEIQAVSACCEQLIRLHVKEKRAGNGES